MFEIIFLAIDTPEQTSAVESMFLKYYEKMVKIACKILKNIPDSEDVAMTVFEKICNDPDRHLHYENEDELCAKLSIITQYVAIDVYRRNRRKGKRTVSLDEDLTGGIIELEDPEQDLLEMAITEENKNMLESAIGELDVMYRTPLLLKYCYDYSGVEIAALLDMKANTVQVRIHRAKKLLKARMLELGYIR